MSKLLIFIITGSLSWLMFTAGAFWWGIGVLIVGVLLLIGKHEEDKNTANAQPFFQKKPVKTMKKEEVKLKATPEPVGKVEQEMSFLRNLGKRSKLNAPQPKQVGKQRKRNPAKLPAILNRKKKGGTLNVGETIRIDYISASEEWTTRDVVVREVSDDYIEGFCLLRRKHRMFRRDRIQGDILVLNTGELVAP
jgi:hypothetical protein